MSLAVFWSDRLEALAEGLFKGWETAPVRDPFARTCIVVGDMSTRNWLQSYFLLHRRPGRRRILANVDFKPLPELANDWLAAACGKNGERRTPAEHPYAKNVLAWRIDAILKDQARNPDLATPLAYVRRAKESVMDRRRFELSTRLAELFDDYLGARYRILARWEAGELPTGDARWQAALYRLLAQEVPGTYTRDYARALGAETDPQAAFANGFSRYAAIHVFDVAFAPWPYLLMLRKMSEAVPTTFWNFNPSRDYWLDDATKKEARREWARAVLVALQNGDAPPEATPEDMFETPDARLLGALAGGARGVLAAQLDLAEGACDWMGDEGVESFAALRNLVPEVHVCHSPRRELEAARDALHRFFDEVPDARLSDALVLCADWGSYAPLVPSVFGAGGEGSVPFALDGGVQEPTLVTHSLEELLAFRTNRFEASAVFSLLGVPPIRARFGIDADGLSVLRDMVRGNNIRWGYDDADVNDVLGVTPPGEHYPFTWRRGLDRFVADALIGPREEPEALVAVGALGRLRPCGAVEAERARLVGALTAFVTALADLRAFLKRSHSIEAWRARLVAAIDGFYLGDDETNDELAGLRRAVVSATDDALVARAVGRAPSRNDPVPGDVRGGPGGREVRRAARLVVRRRRAGGAADDRLGGAGALRVDLRIERRHVPARRAAAGLRPDRTSPDAVRRDGAREGRAGAPEGGHGRAGSAGAELRGAERPFQRGDAAGGAVDRSRRMVHGVRAGGEDVPASAAGVQSALLHGGGKARAGASAELFRREPRCRCRVDGGEGRFRGDGRGGAVRLRGIRRHGDRSG